MVCKDALFRRTFEHIGTENESEIRFQTAKLDHANAPIMFPKYACMIILSSCQLQLGRSVRPVPYLHVIVESSKGFYKHVDSFILELVSAS